MEFSNLKELLMVGEAASVLGVSAATLRRWDRTGRLCATKHPINGYRLYRRGDLEEFLRSVNSSDESGSIAG